MAHLASKATDGRLSFTKYVTDNKRYTEIDYEIEKGLIGNLYKAAKTGLVIVKQLKAETKFKIIDTKLYEISGLKLAKVKVGAVEGMIEINKIRKPTNANSTQYEDEVVEAINNYILECGGKVDIKLKGDSTIYKDIAYAIKVDKTLKRLGGVRGDPKADIILCKDIKTPLVKGSIYLSHKKAGGAEAFQQYGGLSELAGEEIYNHPLVQKFLGNVVNILGDKDQLPSPVMGTFKDVRLSNLSIYGPEFGKAFSLQHVQAIGQGHAKFTVSGKNSELTFDGGMGLSGNLSHFTGNFLPVFGATFRAGRGFEYKNKRYNGVRLGIYPQKLMATRTGLIKIEL